jgi:hypothetical protein
MAGEGLNSYVDWSTEGFRKAAMKGLDGEERGLHGLDMEDVKWFEPRHREVIRASIKAIPMQSS